MCRAEGMALFRGDRFLRKAFRMNLKKKKTTQTSPLKPLLPNLRPYNGAKACRLLMKKAIVATSTMMTRGRAPKQIMKG